MGDYRRRLKSSRPDQQSKDLGLSECRGFLKPSNTRGALHKLAHLGITRAHRPRRKCRSKRREISREVRSRDESSSFERNAISQARPTTKLGRFDEFFEKLAAVCLDYTLGRDVLQVRGDFHKRQSFGPCFRQQ